MNVAILFNSGAKKYGGSYGDPIRNTVFSSKIIQSSRRHMKVSVGDVSIYSHAQTWSHYDELCERVYFTALWSRLLKARLLQTFRKSTVYALIFENMTKDIATRLHRHLTRDNSYLGLMEVDYAYGPHLVFFRNYMRPMYRVEAKTCRVFFTMGDDDGKDPHELKAMRRLGFATVDWEDIGARHTIFDDFDTLEHFTQVAAFRDTVAQHMSDGGEGASELVMMLEDLNPQLFNSLGSAIHALRRGQHEEDVAQAALSGRRYLERLADVLFPARVHPYKGRKVGKQQYRTRIWSFIGDNLVNEPERLRALGNEVDRIVEEFNAGLHGNPAKDRILRALGDVAKLTAALLVLNPVAARNPYYAYKARIFEFFSEVIKERPKDG